MTDIKTLTAVIALIGAIVAPTLYVHNTFAKADELQVAESKANYAMDLQIEELQAQIIRLEAKRNKTADDRDMLKYLREKLERLKKMRNL